MTVDELADEVQRGEVDTVVVAFTDMQGRLLGKRLDADHFLATGDHGYSTHACNYLLAVDMEMDTVPGYRLASWEQGYGDFSLRPDLGTLRRLPWHEGTALVLADLTAAGGEPVRQSPRQVLKDQVARARALGFDPMFGSELEFYLLRETFADARARDYRDLTPSVAYNLDYHLLATGYDESFIRAVRKAMKGAGIPVEGSKGEAWAGQHEINFRFADALTMADSHSLYKTGIKEIAYQHGCSVTFMAKPDHRWIGSSCHVHSSLWQGAYNCFAGESETFRNYLAGQIAHLGELAVFVAPNVNSYKRFVDGSWAPTSLAWGHDNRTCGFRVVGEGQATRAETRIPGADANPYLAFAALLAAGLSGIEARLDLPPAVAGNAYESDAARFPSTLRAAIAALESSATAHDVFSEDVVEHYLNYARTEQDHFDRVVTDFERRLLFERG